MLSAYGSDAADGRLDSRYCIARLRERRKLEDT